jgi:dTDP-glucose 4,6-dehydratase
MKVLITGGAGFIGSNFCHYFLNKHPNYQIVVIDSLTYAANISSIQSLIDSHRISFYQIDIRDTNRINQLFNTKKFDYVINFAAESHVDRSISNPSIFLETNVIGTQILLDASVKTNVKRFHQISTDEVYGDLPLESKELLFDEFSPIRPSSPYAASKTAADLLVLSYFRTYKLPITISRCSNNYGPFQFPEKLIPVVIRSALNNQSIPVYGTGENVRDWIYVNDHCSAIDKILANGKIGEVYNVGANNEISNITLIKFILDYLKKPYSLIRFVEDRKGHDLRYAINSDKLINELNWNPLTHFKDGIESTILWYVKNL